MHKRIILELMQKNWIILINKNSNNYLDLVNSNYGEICVTVFKTHNMKDNTYIVAIYEDSFKHLPIKAWKSNDYESFSEYLKKYKIKNA